MHLRGLPGISAGHESLRVTDGGVQWLATVLARNRAALSSHEALVQRVAQEMARAGRLAWTGLSLRAQVETVQGCRWLLHVDDVRGFICDVSDGSIQPVE